MLFIITEFLALLPDFQLKIQLKLRADDTQQVKKLLRKKKTH